MMLQSPLIEFALGKTAIHQIVNNTMGKLSYIVGCLVLAATSVFAETSAVPSQALWKAALGGGLYQNPLIFADYSDPDVVRVGDDFFMTASSFNASPGLPVLHSRDLVNWRLIGHALPQLIPEDNFAVPQHGNGVWAPNIRYHDGKFWIFYPDPDYGIYMVHSEDPFNGWSKPTLILAGKGIIDPTPMWDDSGQAWLLHAWAKSRAGKNNILTLHKMSADGTEVEDKGSVIIDGHTLPGYRTLEGPKFYKRKGYYYIFAPAGGVSTGWQAVFRSKNIKGPYEYRRVLEQGDSLVNGPHQGSWVSTPSGENWFIHFQSRLAYGRITHMQPLKWIDDWPVIGVDDNGDGIGKPVSRHPVPKTAKQSADFFILDSDEFITSTLGLQWQWNANFQHSWYSLTARPGHLRLYAQPQADPNTRNMWMQPALLLQKLSAPEFIAETTLRFSKSSAAVDAGLLVFGEDYAWIGVRYDPTTQQLMVGAAHCRDALKGCEESFAADAPLTGSSLTLRASMFAGGGVVFSYQQADGSFRSAGELFQARAGRWVGVKIGLFALRAQGAGDKADYVDVDHFRLREAQW